MEVAAAGGHNVVLNRSSAHVRPARLRQDAAGPLHALDAFGVPRMTPSEALDVTRIYSVAGMLPGDVPLIRHRPFRAPHHTISNAGLVGGGQWPRPGEISG